MVKEIKLEFIFKAMTNAELEAFMAENKFNARARAAWRVASADGCCIFQICSRYAAEPLYTWGAADSIGELQTNLTSAPRKIEEDLSQICDDFLIREEDERYINALKDELHL